MNKRKIFIGILLVGLGTVGAIFVQKKQDALLRDKIGQMLIVGFKGTTSKNSGAIADAIEKQNIGGVILFERDATTIENSSKKKFHSRNIVSQKQVKELVSFLKAKSKTPLLVAVDEEGGYVSRLKEKYGFLPTKSAKELDDDKSGKLTHKWTQNIVKNLQSVGVNVNFAPVIDVDVNPVCPVIGKLKRSFSANPKLVSKHALIYINEHHKKNILTALKHFPGHGSSAVDSHLGIADVTNTWNQSELAPYKELIAKNKCDMIMVGHIFNRNIDVKYPASLSKKTIEMLRKLNWNGVVVSDCMMMGAIAKHYGKKEAIKLAINAGVDMLIFGNNTPNGFEKNLVKENIDIIVDLVKKGEIKQATINQACERIQKLKKNLN